MSPKPQKITESDVISGAYPGRAELVPALPWNITRIATVSAEETMAGGNIRSETFALLAELEMLLDTLERNPGNSIAMERVCFTLDELGSLGACCRNPTLESLGYEAGRVFDLLRCTCRPPDQEVIRLVQTTFERIKLLF